RDSCSCSSCRGAATGPASSTRTCERELHRVSRSDFERPSEDENVSGTGSRQNDLSQRISDQMRDGNSLQRQLIVVQVGTGGGSRAQRQSVRRQRCADGGRTFGSRRSGSAAARSAVAAIVEQVIRVFRPAFSPVEAHGMELDSLLYVFLHAL